MEQAINSNPNIRLADIAKTLKSGQAVQAVTVRAFLRWFFGTQRRGRWIVTYIRSSLDKAGLRTVPDFEWTFLDAEMRFELKEVSVVQSVAPEREVPETVTVRDHTEIRVATSTFADPTYRISKLGAANRSPVSVKPDATMTQATTLMMANDFSQLPVMTTEREVKGAVSWKSIGSRLALGRSLQFARDAMDVHAEISSDASLFTAIPVIVAHEYVLVRGLDQRVSGIITTSDLSLQFQSLSEPFLLLGEIENHIRRIIASKFTQEDLAAARDPADNTRAVEGVADLTFGEYRRLLEEPARWTIAGLQLDRAVFVGLLERIREIRNEVMHFDPDGIEEEALDVLRDFARFLRNLKTVGAT